MDFIKKHLSHPALKYLLFWIGIYSYYILTANLDFYSGYRQLFETYFLIVGIQVITAFVCIWILVPRFLNKGKTVQFILYLILLLIAGYALYIIIKICYFDIKYIESYNAVSHAYAQKTFIERFTHISVFISKSILYLTPTVLLLLVRFYNNQQEYLKLNEQKKIAELSALKNQLNPHFLFNTLNNLYSLAIKRSEKTPEVIGKLSDILDYILYRCDGKYVWLNREIEMIDNYLALEKIRYGKRVEINFKSTINADVKIAPLVLLTFIENAFKHGVREELEVATINIFLEANESEIYFCIKNSIAQSSLKDEEEKDAIGLKNVEKQLELLYPNKYDLEIDSNSKTYKVELKMRTK